MNEPEQQVAHAETTGPAVELAKPTAARPEAAIEQAAPSAGAVRRATAAATDSAPETESTGPIESSSEETCSPANGPERKQAKLWTRDFVLGTVVNFVLCANYFMLMVVMTSYALDVYHAPASLAGFCASIFIVGTLVARFTTATVMARFGQKRTLVVGAAAEIALTALYFLGASLPLLFTVRFVHGFAYGTCSTAIATIVTAMVPLERKGEGIGYYMLSVTLGAALGPFTGIFLSNHFGFGTLFAIAMVVAAVSVPCALTLRRPAADRQARAAMALGKGAKLAENQAEAAEARAEAAALDDIAAEESASPLEARREEQVAASLRVPSTHLEERVTSSVQHSWLARFIEAPVLPDLAGGRAYLLRLLGAAHLPHPLRHRAGAFPRRERLLRRLRPKHVHNASLHRCGLRPLRTPPGHGAGVRRLQCRHGGGGVHGQ